MNQFRIKQFADAFSDIFLRNIDCAFDRGVIGSPGLPFTGVSVAGDNAVVFTDYPGEVFRRIIDPVDHFRCFDRFLLEGADGGQDVMVVYSADLLCIGYGCCAEHGFICLRSQE